MQYYFFGKSRLCQLSHVASFVDVLPEQKAWPIDAAPIVYDGEAATVPAPEYLNHVESVLTQDGELELTRKVTISPATKTTLTIGQILDKIAAWIGPEEVKVQGKIRVGDHRKMAEMICHALGMPIPYDIPHVRCEDPALDLGSNVRHALSSGLKDAEIIPLVVKLMDAGEVSTAADLKRLGFKHGKSQYIANKANLVRLYNVPLADVLRVEDKEAAKILAADKPLEALADHLAGRGEPPVKAIPGKDIIGLVTLARTRGNDTLADLLEAIRTGDLGGAQGLVVTLTPTETPETPKGKGKGKK